MANAAPHFRIDSTPAMEIIHSVISIQLFRSAMSPPRIESARIRMLIIIQTAIA